MMTGRIHNKLMKTYLCSFFVVLTVTWQCAASGDPGIIWGPVTNNAQASILVRNDSPSFTGDEINDAAELIARIKRHEDKVSTFLWQQCPQPVQTAIMDFQPSAANAKQVANSLADVLNKTIAGTNIYSTNIFLGARLAGETRLLLQKHPVGTNLVTLNRLLLEDTYPFELARNSKPEGTVVKKGESIVLIVSLRNVSSNETFRWDVDRNIISEHMIHIHIVTPSRKQISPSPDSHVSRSGIEYRPSPGAAVHPTFQLDKLYKFEEIGRYLVTFEMEISVPGKSPPWALVSSNPLAIRIVP